MYKKALIFFLIVISIFTFSSCKGEEEVISDTTFALDTVVEIKIYQYSNNPKDTALIRKSFDLIKSLEDVLSVHVEGSDIYNLKENAGKQSVEISDTAYRVLQNSTYFSELTDGLFDITAGPLINLWAIDPPYGHVPTQEELDKVLPLIDYHNMKFMGDNKVELEEGMSANLGAIAKGTIADEVKAYLIENGVDNAMINLGGNVLLIGSKLNGSDFRIGIQDPNNDRGEYLMVVKISDEALVSSGDYERFFVQDGEIYHHILNPKTGFPADTNIKQVTIVTKSSEMADGLSTSVLLLGLKNGIELIEKMDEADAIFITKDNMIYVTEGLRDRYEIEPNLGKDYTIVENSEDLY